MKQVYPVIITENANDYVVYIPDFDINTEAKTIPDAIDMAREAIGLCGISNQDIGSPVPEPKTLKPKCGANDIVALVDIDFAQFREREDNRSVRKNCTIPQWLNREAEAHNVNFSAVLQDALKQQLGL